MTAAKAIGIHTLVCKPLSPNDIAKAVRQALGHPVQAEYIILAKL